MEKKERNLEIAKKVLSGSSCKTVGIEYGISEGRAHQLTFRLIRKFMKPQEGRKMRYYQAKWRNGDFAQDK